MMAKHTESPSLWPQQHPAIHPHQSYIQNGVTKNYFIYSKIFLLYFMYLQKSSGFDTDKLGAIENISSTVLITA